MKNRSKVADYAASSLLSSEVDRQSLVNSLTAWLKDTKQTRSTKYLVEDIAKKLAENNYFFVTVTTAQPMSDATKQNVMTYLRQYFGEEITIEINEVISKKIVGGILIDTPLGSLDATVKRKLIQIIKGVQ